MIVLATVAGDAITDAGHAVDVARGASGWLRADGGYALAAVLLALLIAERVFSLLARRRCDEEMRAMREEVTKAYEAVGRANETATNVLVTLLTHEREADDTPPPGTKTPGG